MIPFWYTTGTGDQDILIEVVLMATAWIFTGYEDGTRK